MGDFDIDMPDWDVESTIKHHTSQEYARAVDRKMMKTNAIGKADPLKFRDLGGFRVFKANNGYVIQVGTHEGYAPSDAYICKEASEIGDLITAHIVSATLEK